MPTYLALLLYALGTCFLIMTLVWWRQIYTKNAGIVDGWWSYNFGFIAMLYAFISDGDFTRKVILTLMVLLWSFRLGTHLLIRNTTHHEEDIRYRKLREEYGTHQNFRMWVFFMYQALSNVILSIPFLIINIDTNYFHFSVNVILGIVIWAIALAGESLADYQLKEFKKDKSNKGKVCEVGLWNYSRHPNYFFEWLTWVAYAVFAIGSPFGWIGIFCPLLMYLLLTKVTGIPMLEELAVKSKGQAYVDYQKTTPSFFPWFKRAA